jgi:DNA polymerase I-like protein with 3'-5' exonuclease and polymerase domains
MTARYGTWPSMVLTKGGNPSTTAAVLATLPWPEAAQLLLSKIVSKRITMLSGDNGYLTKLGSDGRLHTVYHTLGTITGRASHQPNIAQVPGVLLDQDKQPLLGADGRWGYEFRSLFIAPPGMVLVGVDLVGLEARIMAHYLAIWDSGVYAALVCADVDLHELNQQATGVSSRAAAKRLFYATCYGCGNRKAGSIVLPDEDDEAVLDTIGKTVKSALIGGIVGFGELIAWLDGMADDTIPGLDGRPIHARKRHARVNTIIQSAGAIIAKRWLVLTDQALHAAGLRYGVDYALLAWVHDETITACRPELAEKIAAITKACAVQAGELYHLDCPMAASAKIGASWAAVH